MRVYINYPKPHITIHHDYECAEFHKNQKENQRTILVNLQNFTQVLTDFIEGKYAFRAEKELNDLWLDITLDSPELEKGFVLIIQALLGLRYTPIKKAPVGEHCKLSSERTK